MSPMSSFKVESPDDTFTKHISVHLSDSQIESISKDMLATNIERKGSTNIERKIITEELVNEVIQPHDVNIVITEVATADPKY